ncbi:unnamed protein product [Ceutorhynchus assimilis]|uniref:Protein THEM6 n=1 Tax=Ceutorhynchus assimilis TaxID=467358 RepID=A0A9N9QHQ3_9CUCU|nr:unnamed protein product [Ceutorhynchus assimilis]
MEIFLMLYAVFVTILLLFYVFFDVNYFIRIAATILWGRVFDKTKNVDEQTEIYGICTTQDVDIFFKHMNNARFVRDLDFARFHFYDKTGIYAEIVKAKGHVLQTASNIRYRRTIPLMRSYKITTKIVFWDEKTLFIEHQFITLADNFISAVVLSKQSTIGLDVPKIMSKLNGKDVSYRPTPPPELEDWLKSNEKSSKRLRMKKSD